MAFGDRRGNPSADMDNDIRKSLNTRGCGFYNEAGYEATAISFQYWKEMLKIQIAPALPEEKRTASNRYDYSTGISVYLTTDKARDLYNGMSQFYNVYLSGVNPEKFGVDTKNGFVEIATGESLGIKAKANNIFLVLYDNVDDEAKTDVYITFEFPTSKIIKNYNNTTGVYDMDAANGSFETFMAAILTYSQSMSGAIGHAVRWAGRDDTYQDNLKMAALLKANGVKVDEFGRVAFERKESPFNKGVGGGASNATSRPPINSSVDDIERELGNMDNESDELPY